MPKRYHTESGAKLFSRLRKKESLQLLCGGLFDQPLDSGVLIEINGTTTGGPLTLAIDLMATCILNRQDGGLAKGVLMIDCESHFKTDAAVAILEGKLPTNADHMVSIKQALARLRYVRCADWAQFAHSFDLVDDLAYTTPELLSMLIIDSISAFVWEEPSQLNARQEQLAKRIQQVADEHKLVVVFTSQSVANKALPAERKSLCQIIENCWRAVPRLSVNVEKKSAGIYQCFANDKLIYMKKKENRIVFDNNFE